MNDFFKNIPSKWRGYAYVLAAVAAFGFGTWQVVIAAMSNAQTSGQSIGIAVAAAVVNYAMSFVGILARVNLTPESTVPVVEEAVKDAQDSFEEAPVAEADATVSVEESSDPQ